MNSEYVVFAGCRRPETATALMEMHEALQDGRLHIMRLDVTSEESIKEAAMKTKHLLKDKGLDILLNNAAIVSVRSSRRVPICTLISK